MKEVPLVTVLVVTYNHKDTFCQAIKSVLSQKTTFEFIVWVLDDCSNDGTTELAREYADRYPDKVIPIVRERNLGGIQNVFQALRRIDTKYYATLESDDYWCDDNKLQAQVDILEVNPDCSFCAHSTAVHYPDSSERVGYRRSSRDQKTQKVCFPEKRKQFIQPHYSSRVYRTSCLCLDEVKNPLMACYDTAQIFWFLSKGKMYYIDRVMSVYNVHSRGLYTSASYEQKQYMSAKVICIINKEFDYRYNAMFLDFLAASSAIGKPEYFRLKYFTPKNRLSDHYEKVLKRFENRLLTRNNIKQLFSIVIPLSKNKRICLEMRREKR